MADSGNAMYYLLTTTTTIIIIIIIVVIIIIVIIIIIVVVVIINFNKMKKEVGMLLQKQADTRPVGIYKLYEENTH